MKAQESQITETIEVAPPKKSGISLPFDPCRLIDTLVRFWKPIALAGIICGAMALAFSFWRFRNEYQAGLHLIRQEPPNSFVASETGESFKPRTLAVQTVVSVMRSPALLKTVAAASSLTPGQLNVGLTLVPERNTDLIRVEFKTAASPEVAVRVVNRYAEGVVDMTRQMQADEAGAVNRFLEEQLRRAEEEIAGINAQLLAYGREANLLNADKEFDAYLRKQSDLDLKYEMMRIEHETINVRIQATEYELSKNSPAAAKLQTERNELSSLLSKFTDSNPMVLEQRTKIASLEKDIANAPKDISPSVQAGQGGGVADSLYLELVSLRATQQTFVQQLAKLDIVRVNVAKQLGALPEKQMEYARIQSRKTSLEHAHRLLESRQREASLFSQKALGYYRILATANVSDAAVFSRNKKVIFITLAGLLGGAGLVASLLVRRVFDGLVTTPLDLRRGTGLEVLAALPQGAHRMTQREAWAFRTWTSLRSRLGIGEYGGVIGFLTREPGLAFEWLELFAEAASRRGQRVIVFAHTTRADLIPLSIVLQDPLLILDVIEDKNPLTISIDENFVWTAIRRSRWHAATQLWLSRLNAVILLEISAPGEPESVLLCEQMPEMIVLASSGESSVVELTDLVAPYREAGCHFSGAALDAAPALRPAWLASKLQSILSTVLVLFFFGSSAFAAEVAPKPKVLKSAKPAWLQRYTLGPGDGFDISVYNHPDLTRTEVFVGSEGRLIFWHANVMAQGLTIDELRTELNREIAKLYQHGKVIISPIAYMSKRVFILGKVIKKGAVILDRPLTVLEAVAEAGGLETGLFQLNTVELADLPRSMLVRKGQRMPCDFDKLFNEGDMRFNFLLEPDDYLHFPSSNSNDFQIFGSVKNAGTQALTPNVTVISSITLAGNFTEKAWRKRVLVIRGSLNKPETIVVNVDDILAGRERDVRIQPGDIIYVADRPWAKAEELIESAIIAFTQAAVASWTGANVGPLISRPILPQR